MANTITVETTTRRRILGIWFTTTRTYLVPASDFTVETQEYPNWAN